MNNSQWGTPPAPPTKIRVWDAPLRIFHWLLALCFAGAYISAESESWRLLHVTLGYTLGGLVAFRLVWGVVGTRYARFGSFVRGPAAVLRYLQSLRTRAPEHHLGHNPAGAVAVLLLLVLGACQVASGYAVYEDLGPEWLEEVHELLGNGMLLVVIGHLVGVLSASLLHRENLVRAMLTGYKWGRPEQGIRRNGAWLAVAMVLAVAAFWWWQWRSAPPAADAAATAATAAAATQPGTLHHSKDGDKNGDKDDD